MRHGFLALLILTSAASQANLVLNGSFEDGTLPASGSYESLNPGSLRLPNWIVSQAEIAWANGMAFGVSPSDGLGHLDLFGFHDSFPSGKISQALSTTIGQAYRVRFDVGTFNGNVAQVRVAAGSQSGDFTNSDGNFTWLTSDFVFVASSASTLLSFEAGPGSSNVHAGLDNVSVEAAPEPASLCALGLGALALLRRHRVR